MSAKKPANPLSISPILTCAETRILEKRIADPGAPEFGDLKSGDPVPLIDLMARAGQACYNHIRSTLGRRLQTVLVLCGPGGNGGDGYVIARHLLAAGHTVLIFALAAPSAGSDAAFMLAQLMKAGGTLIPDLEPIDMGDIDLVVDALFGAGLSRPFDHGPSLSALKQARTSGIPVFAVDVPSGLNGDTGRAWGNCTGADETVTFFTPKPGHVMADGPDLCGALDVADLGVDISALNSIDHRVDSVSLPGFFVSGGHKYNYGHALVLSGPQGRTGAARLAAMAALRMGAGLVTVACPNKALAENAAHVTSIQLRVVDTSDDINSLLSDHRYNALIMGPGMGTGQKTCDLVLSALKTGRQMVLDADALTAFQDDPEPFFEALHENCVLTPHAGEFARLFPDLILDDPEKSKLDQVKAATKRTGAHILLKGPGTIIAAPDGHALIVAAIGDQAAPSLATAGSGDVLAGLIGGRLARDKSLSMIELIAQAVWIHQEIGRRAGPGLIAEDQPLQLPNLLRELML